MILNNTSINIYMPGQYVTPLYSNIKANVQTDTGSDITTLRSMATSRGDRILDTNHLYKARVSLPRHSLLPTTDWSVFIITSTYQPLIWGWYTIWTSAELNSLIKSELLSLVRSTGISNPTQLEPPYVL